MENKFKVGDIVRIKEKAYRPWTVTQTQMGDMVIVKAFQYMEGCECQYIIERADGEYFTAVYGGEPYDYKQDGFYEDDLELIEGRRF